MFRPTAYRVRCLPRAPHGALASVTRVACVKLQVDGLQLEYAEVRDPEAWSPNPPNGPITRAQALVAARVGKVRLIDTLRLDAKN